MQNVIKLTLLLAYGFGLIERSQALIYNVQYGSWFQVGLAATLGFLTFLLEL